MEQRRFGATDLRASAVGFGAWAIGGPAMAGTTPLGWGRADDATSMQALQRARDLGITFFDTADIYGIGHSEELIGRAFGPDPRVVIATKAGNVLTPDGRFGVDYSASRILRACEESLRRLRRDVIDYYQLHSARLEHLERGECIEAMERLREQGKIRYWGLSLNTFAPEPEAAFLMDRNLGSGFQLVLNILNQRAVPLLERAQALGYGIIARMPLQFGLLARSFTPETRFAANDHRHFRLPPEVLEEVIPALNDVWELARERSLSPTALALGFCLSFPEVSTVIPGIRTPGQAEANTSGVTPLPADDRDRLRELFSRRYAAVLELLERQG